MTINEAKKDAKTRLDKASIKFDKLSAKTLSFEGLGYGTAIFITIHGVQTPFGPHRRTLFADVPKPSNGGYVVKFSDATFS